MHVNLIINEIFKKKFYLIMVISRSMIEILLLINFFANKEKTMQF